MNNSDSRLRILFVAKDNFPPYRSDVSVLFGQEMIGRGHKIDWILQSADHCRKSYQTKWASGSVWVGRTDLGTSRLGKLRKNIYDIIHDFKMFGLARSSKYDFIQVKDKCISAILGIIVARTCKSNFIYWLSYPFPEAAYYAAKKGTARYLLYYATRGILCNLLLYHVIMPRADHIFLQSEQMKKDVASKGVSENKMTAVPMGVDLNEILGKWAEKDSQVMRQEKAVVYLGALHKIRKIDFLIKVFAMVQKQVPSAKLYLVGGADDPNDEQMLKDQAARLGIDNAVKFTGFLPRQAAWDYVRKSTVCVSPIFPTPVLNAGSPTKLIEYMAMGRPVVANDHPEQQLVISESGAGICVPYEEEAFAEAIVKLLNDPEISKDMGSKGRKYIEKHRSYNAIADLVEEEYLRICGSQELELVNQDTKIP